MELISAIAILSIVAIAAFTLLMFSINSNNMILAGASASQDAELLNKRLAILFDKHYVSIEDSTEGEEVEFSLERISFYEKEDYSQETNPKSIEFDNEVLSIGGNVCHENLSNFSISSVNGTSLIKISYSIGDHQFTKLFRVNFVPENDQQPQNIP